MAIVASLPDPALLDLVRALAPDADLRIWTMEGPATETVDLAVGPNLPPFDRTRRWGATARGARLLQLPFIGYDPWIGAELPAGMAIANAASVHEPLTAELAATLILTMQRDIPAFHAAQLRGEYASVRTIGLAGCRVIVVGAGGIGSALRARLLPFEADVVRVASTARTDADGAVHGVEELPGLLPGADVVVLAVPLTETTAGMVDAAFLAAMPDGALLVNVGRGPLVRTGALLAEVQRGRLRAALDVIDPEPLPADHPIRSVPGVLITPHVGPATRAMLPRMAALVARQIGHLERGEEPENIVIRG